MINLLTFEEEGPLMRDLICRKTVGWCRDSLLHTVNHLLELLIFYVTAELSGEGRVGKYVG